MYWTVSRINESNIPIKYVDMSSYPSSSSSSLFIPKGSLEAGLYRFEFTVVINNQTTLINDSETAYIQIEKLGIIVNCLGSAVSSFRIGKNQEIKLDPITNSYFSNYNKLPPEQLFTFNCRKINFVNNSQNLFNADIISANGSKCFSSQSISCQK